MLSEEQLAVLPTKWRPWIEEDVQPSPDSFFDGSDVLEMASDFATALLARQRLEQRLEEAIEMLEAYFDECRMTSAFYTRMKAILREETQDATE